MLVQTEGSGWGGEICKVDVVNGDAVPLVATEGESVNSNSDGFLVDHNRRSVALCDGYEMPLFDLESLKQTGTITPMLAGNSANNAIYRQEDQSLLRASFEGLYFSQRGFDKAVWSAEHPKLFRCVILGFSLAYGTYLLLNSEGNRIGVVNKHLNPGMWWDPSNGGIAIPSDHRTVRLNDRGDRVVVVRLNKRIDVFALAPRPNVHAHAA